jgi:uncharacterized OsmC-like protein
MKPRLTQTTLTARRLPGIEGRAMVSARSQHLLVDAPVMLGGPNESMNPVDLLLSALTSHAIFVCKYAARQSSIPLSDIRITAQADFDPRGVVGEAVYPGLQSLHLRFELNGPNGAQAEALIYAMQTRCPIYTTLARAVTIQHEIVLADAASASGAS